MSAAPPLATASARVKGLYVQESDLIIVNDRPFLVHALLEVDGHLGMIAEPFDKELQVSDGAWRCRRGAWGAVERLADYQIRYAEAWNMESADVLVVLV